MLRHFKIMCSLNVLSVTISLKHHYYHHSQIFVNSFLKKALCLKNIWVPRITPHCTTKDTKQLNYEWMNCCFLINKSHKKGSIDLKKILLTKVQLIDLYSILNLYFLEINVRKMSMGKEMDISHNKPSNNSSL